MKILIAEDEAISRRILETKLREWGYEVLSTKNGQEAWEVLQKEDSPRLAILDWMMPEKDGIEICMELRKARKRPYTYILLLTARNQKEDLIEAMEAGVDDYIAKPFDPPELQVRLRAGQRIIALQEELMAAQEALRIQATHDPLTGLWNRAAIFDILRRELARGKREAAPIGVIMADLDHFKPINDTHGHMCGDEVLVETAKRMLGSVRPYDAVGRYGGEEFLIILPGCDKPGLMSAAERLRVRIGQQPMSLSDTIVSVTLSLGAVVAGIGALSDAESVIRVVDEALYRAKAEGRNRVEFAAPSSQREEALRAE